MIDLFIEKIKENMATILKFVSMVCFILALIATCLPGARNVINQDERYTISLGYLMLGSGIIKHETVSTVLNLYIDGGLSIFGTLSLALCIASLAFTFLSPFFKKNNTFTLIGAICAFISSISVLLILTTGLQESHIGGFNFLYKGFKLSTGVFTFAFYNLSASIMLLISYLLKRRQTKEIQAE